MKQGIVYTFFGLMILSLCTSCLKDDNAVVLPMPGESKLFAVDQHDNYEHQVYFKLQTQDTLGSDFAKWDLAFDDAQTGAGCWMNSGKLMLIGNTNTTNFESVTDTNGYKLNWDGSDWQVQTSAIGKIENMTSGVYIVDRGYKYSAPNRFYKLQFLQNTTSFYELKMARLTDTGFVTMKINKANVYSYSYFSFDNNGTILLPEPVKNNWDIQFTRYLVILANNGKPFPYLVTGVQINNMNTMACVDSTTTYENVTYEFAKTKTLSAARDAIGYDWKYFDFGTQKYKVRSNYIFIIKDSAGIFWKLRFLDFYNNLGKKGNPKFEYQRL